MSDAENKKVVSVIPLRRRPDPGPAEFRNLPVEGKLAFLREKTAVERAELIIFDTEGKTLARSLHPQELYSLIKETGETDSLPLMEFSSPDQFRFFLDMELWEKWSFSGNKAMEWLAYLMKSGEERVIEQLNHLDFELILLLCKKEFFVGGGIGDLVSDEERSADWDHTFDNIFFITYRDKRHEQLMGRFLDIVFHNDRRLYLSLMEGVKSEIESELEEVSFRFRTGRLADLGFPELDEALSIYGYLDPENFVAAGDKAIYSVDAETRLPVSLPPGNSLFRRALAIAGSDLLYAELNYLINTVLVAEDAPFADRDAMDAVLRRVCGYLDIALERLCADDAEKAARILDGEYLKRLFQLGYSILFGLRKRALKLAGDTENHAANRALLGLRNKRPQFYRGLDADHVDGFREFADMDDVRAADLFLSQLEQIRGGMGN